MKKQGAFNPDAFLAMPDDTTDFDLDAFLAEEEAPYDGPMARPKPGAQAPTSSYSGPTDYRTEAGLPAPGKPSDKGPSTEDNQRASEQADEDRGFFGRNFGVEGKSPRELGTENERSLADTSPLTPQEREARDNPHDPITEMIITGLPATGIGRGLAAAGSRVLPGAGSVLRRLGNVVRGGAEGAAATGMAGGGAREMEMGALLGGAIGGLNRPAAAPRAPRTPAEIDASVMETHQPGSTGLHPIKATARAIRRVLHPDPVIDDILQRQTPQETLAAAQEADALVGGAADARKVANGRMLEVEGNHDFASLDADYPIPHTEVDIQQLQGIRHSSHGGQGPTLRSDPVLERMQHQLTIGEGRTPMVPRGELRNVQEALNNEADFSGTSNDKLAQNSLQRGAKVVSDAVRRADPREGPGNIGGVLDKFGAEKDALANIEELRGPPGQRVQKIARVGGADPGNPHDLAALESEGEVAQLMAAEPAGKKLVDLIRFNNTQGRRGFKLPYIGYSATGNAMRFGQKNISNINFNLRPPKIDEAGMVVPRSRAQRYGMERNTLALPLELQLLMDEQQQQEDRR